MSILSLIVLALIGEAVWETLKMTWQSGKVSVDRIGAIVVGLLLALGSGLDLMAMVDIPIKIPFIGMVLTGLLISRGANFIHDLLASINNIQQNIKTAALPKPIDIMTTNTTSKGQEAAAVVHKTIPQENPTAENNNDITGR